MGKSDYCLGSVKLKTLPSPRRLVAEILPPCASTMPRDMLKPGPVPRIRLNGILRGYPEEPQRLIKQCLGTCWGGAINPKEIHKVMGLPDDIFVHSLLPLGYPDEDPKPRLRIDPNKVIFREQYEPPGG